MTRIHFPLDRLLTFIGTNQFFRKIAKKVMLSPWIGRWFEETCRFYAVAQIEERLDNFSGGDHSRPQFGNPYDHLPSLSYRLIAFAVRRQRLKKLAKKVLLSPYIGQNRFLRTIVRKVLLPPYIFLRKIAKKVMLSPYIDRWFAKTRRFYAVARFEEGLDNFIGGYYSRPRFENLYPPTLDVEVNEKNLIDIKRILDKAGIKFWLSHGTFLGAYRDQAIIPYDVDTDLAIYAEDLPKLVSCENEFAEEGFYLGLGVVLATLYRGREHTDIYLFRPAGSKRVWEQIKYDVCAFETYNEIQFLGQSWRILNEPERWLRYTYGEDWRIPIKGKDAVSHPFGEEFESEGS